MAMTKKDLEAIADIINGNAPTREPNAAGFDEGYICGRNVALADVTDELVDYFKSVNPNFDEERFRKACGI